MQKGKVVWAEYRNDTLAHEPQFVLSKPTCYIEVLLERGGDCVLIPFAKPGGGPEGMAQIGGMLKRWIANKAIMNTDKCYGYISFCKDNPEKEIFHPICNHSQTDEFGFVW